MKVIHSLKISVSEYHWYILNAILGPSPYTASYQNAIGKIIFSSYGNSSRPPEKKLQKSERIYEIQIPRRWVDKHGITFIDNDSLKDFLETVEKQFKIQLYTYIDGVLDFKLKYNKLNNDKIVAKMKDAAQTYLEKFDMNEDIIKFDTVKKGYQRYKSNLKSLNRVA